jgi:SSS family solute:Na+ symporter
MSLIDYGIIVVYLFSVFYIGIRYRDRSSDFSTFMIADRKVGLSLGVATMLGTELGLITVMYNAQTGVLNHFSAFHIGLFAFIVTLAVGLTGIVVVKLRELEVKSIPEYYEIRFGRRVRVLGAILLAIGGILNMGLFLKVGAIFIQGIFGIDPSGATLTVIMIILLVMVLIYTMLGGMISVIITDYIQFVVLSIGLIISVIICIAHFGWSDIFTKLGELTNQSPAIYDPIQSRGGFYITWQVVLGFVSAVVWPTAITRALSLDSPETVKKQYIWSSVSFLIRFMIPCFLGICAYIHYGGAVDENTLIMMPRFLSEILPIGVLGIMTAAMLAAFMSTHDSYLLCWSTIITNDIIDPLCGGNLSSRKKIKFSRIIILILGIYILYWGLVYNGGDSIWSYLGITGAIYFTGAISVILFGIYWKKASSTGAIAALLGGLSALFGLEPIRISIPMISEMKPEEIGLLTLLITAVSMVVFSLLFPDKKEERLSL